MTSTPLTLLPDVRSEDDYKPLRWDAAVWQPALRALCERHGLDPTRFERATDGTHVVWLGPEVVLKLFVRIWPEDHARELSALALLAGSDLPVPRLLASGELAGWPYLLQERLAGTAVKHVWSTIALDDQRDLAAQTGALLARLHALPVSHATPPLADDDWRAFLAERLERCVEHQHARGGASPSMIDEVRALLRDVPELIEPNFRPRLIHADLTYDHLLVEKLATGRWRVVGLIDWADAMLGHPLYDLAVPATFLAQGRPGVGPALLRGYGLALDADLARRLLWQLMLHKYGNLASALRVAHGEPARDLPGLQRSLWGL